VSLFPHQYFAELVQTYGYWTVGLIVALESMGVPVPGEAILIAAAVYAGTTNELTIWPIMTAAAAGAIVGDTVGFWIGRTLGHRLLLRYGPYIGLTESRLKVGQYLFLRHGGKIVFFGRFFPVLRMLAALLAGANCMPWPRFFLYNAAGGIIWVGVYGIAAFRFGERAQHFSKTAGIAMIALAGVLLIFVTIFLRRHEAQLEFEAEQALPGPLQHSPVRRRS
jgi:membrane protein DedA with SNARE-associated domain